MSFNFISIKIIKIIFFLLFASYISSIVICPGQKTACYDYEQCCNADDYYTCCNNSFKCCNNGHSCCNKPQKFLMINEFSSLQEKEGENIITDSIKRSNISELTIERNIVSDENDNLKYLS